MDPINIQKLQAMKKYKKNQFLDNFILYSFTALTFILLCYSPFWFPSLCSSIKIFFFVSLPKIGSLLFNPKCLFIVSNIIIIFLVGESKLVGSKSSSPGTEIYDEYVKRSGGLQRLQTVEEKKEELCLIEESEEWVVKENVKKSGEGLQRLQIVEERKDELHLIEESEKRLVKEEGETKEQKEDEENLDEEEELGLPAEELNKRVEDFIARINKQRRLEAGLFVSNK